MATWHFVFHARVFKIDESVTISHGQIEQMSQNTADFMRLLFQVSS